VALDADDRRVEWFNEAAQELLDLRYPQDLGTRLTRLESVPRVAEWLRGGAAEPLLDLPSPFNHTNRLTLRLLDYTTQQKLLVVRDVSKLMHLEQVRRDFVANVSHELRTPLTVVHGYLDMIDPEDMPEFATMLREMRTQSLRMTQIVEDLLTISRLEAQEALPKERIVMRALLLTLQREAQALSHGQHTIELVDSAGVDLAGSNKELHSAFSNLVSNAVRYTPAGGRIRIVFERFGDGLRFAVEDTGYGIPAQHIPRITERFYRVSTSRSRESGGTGLGLSIVKHVLNLHGGRLTIESEVGRGSTFACEFGPERIVDRSVALSHPDEG
jgi:two-component system phosphate regulon sensor histidine kinase PhoR